MTQESLKTLKIGQKFTVVTFTGLNIGQFAVTAVSKSQFKAVKQDGTEMVFDRATGAQVNATNPKYANKAVDLMDAPVFNRTPKAKPVVEVAAAEEGKDAAKPAKPAKVVEKVPAAVEEIEAADDEFEDFEEIE